MFSFLKPKPRYPSECKWSVCQGQWDGHPLFLRRNETAEKLRGHPDFCFRLGVAIPLLAPNENGLPDNVEMESLNKIEDFLCSAFEQDQNAIHVLAITTKAMREFIFYSRKPDVIEPTIEQARSAFPDYSVQFYVARDPGWEGYARFA